MAQKKYLDLNGLEYYTEQVKDAIGEATGVTTVDPVDPVQTDILIPTKTSQLENDSGFITNASIDNKQDKLVSGTNIKTINNESLLGSGNITISSGSGGVEYISASFLKTAAQGSTTITSEQRNLIASNNLFYYTEGDYVYRSVGTRSNGLEINIMFESELHKKYNFYINKNNYVYMTEYGTGVDDIKINNTSIVSNGSANIVTNTAYDSSSNKIATMTDIGTKQDTLVSGTNIKTINNQSLLGSGNINISGGSGGSSVDVQVNGTSIISNDIANIITESAYDSSTNKIATMSDVNNNKIEYTDASFLRTAALNKTAITSEQRSLIDSHNFFYLSRVDTDDGNLPSLYYRSTGYFKFDIGVTSIKFECGNKENYIFTIYRNNTVGMTSYNNESTSNKITNITSSSTDTQYPSAKAVYDLFTSITNGDEVSY